MRFEPAKQTCLISEASTSMARNLLDRRCKGPGSMDIELASLTKRFGDVPVVDNLNLKIRSGTYCCLLGPSGCGKTTTLRMIAGHERETDGDIVIGHRVVGDLPPAQRGTALMFQNYALFPHLNCLDNVAFGLKMRGVGKAERATRARAMLALVQMELYANRLPAQLSGGQQQRVALARALVTRPSVLLLDDHSPPSIRSCASACARSSSAFRPNSASPSSM